MCKIIKKSDSQKAFTITEVVVAAALLALAIAPILQALTSAYTTSSDIEQKSISLMYAKAKLDEIRVRAIYNYSTDFDCGDTSLGNSFFYRVQDTANGANLKTITVTVGYDTNSSNSLSSDEFRVTLSTLIARRY